MGSSYLSEEYESKSERYNTTGFELADYVTVPNVSH